MTTVRELLEGYNLNEIDYIDLFTGDVNDIKTLSFHSDFIEDVNEGRETEVINGKHSLSEEQLNMKVVQSKLMDTDEYNHSVLANTCLSTKDYGWSNNEKILCVLVRKK